MINIQPYATVMGLQRALGASPGVSIPIKYIRVGKGFQTIQLDDAGRATTENLADPVGYAEILNARKITPYQWQCVIDLKELHTGQDFNFSEFAICDADQQTIAIYGHPTQALYAVTAVLDNALLAVNIVLATLPANSIEIIHRNLPLEMFLTRELVVLNNAVGAMSAHFIQQNQELQSINARLTALEN